MIRWSTGNFRRDALKAKLGQTQAINEDINRPDRIVVVYPILNAFGK